MPLVSLSNSAWLTMMDTRTNRMAVSQVQQLTKEQIDPVLIVEWYRKSVFPGEQRVVFSGGVRATFGPTVLECDELKLNQSLNEGIASGHVRVIDPEGTLSSSNLKFNWKEKSGHATGATIDFGSLRLIVKELDIVNGIWKFQDAKVASLIGTKPAFWLDVKTLKVEPGKDAVFGTSSLRLGNTRLISFPAAKLSLDKRISSLSIPTINFRKRSGPGLSWDTNRFLGPQALIAGSFATFPGLPPSYGLQILQSWVDGKRAGGLVIPRSELADRFTDSWFDSITARTPEQQVKFQSSPKVTAGLGTFWNQSTRGRLRDSDSISKRFELSTELGGPTEFGGTSIQARLQSIRPASNEPYLERLVLGVTNVIKPIPLTSSSSIWLRGDSFFTTGKSSFGWGRATIGFTAFPLKTIQIGAAQIFAASWGKPDFGFDDLYSKHALHVRGTVQLGSFRLGALSKYDYDRRKWYDHQFELAMRIGVLEPYILYRQFPSDIRVGLTLRLDSLVDRLQNREIKRL